MFSCRGIRGSKEPGNHGLADLLLFQKECLGFVLGCLPFNLGFSEGSWISLARVHVADYDSHNSAPTIWTRACTGPQLLYVELCENLVYGTTIDSCLKLLVQNTTDVHSLEKQAGISKTLAEIKAQVEADIADAEAISSDDADAPASTYPRPRFKSS